ncbi:MAG TPA: MBL fold metallo-hydrolase [Terriglobales bacterium]|nr:MBL fold metallo-hydrolase [Terriglobales bacterium]
MKLRLIRHATLLLEYNGQKIIVDPMLDAAGARPAIQNSPNPHNNPLVDLPMPASEVVKDIAAILVTHTHSDHWDSTAAKVLPKALPFFGQPEDEAKFRGEAFSDVRPLREAVTWEGIELHRTGGQHGTGEIAKMLAPVSGFVLRASAEPALYIAGDTIWCGEVQDALRQYKPDIVVLNSGGARFLDGDPITMTADDVIKTCQHAPQSQIIAVHMEAINHCLLTRADLAFQLEAARVIAQAAIPGDGEWVDISS